MIITGSRIATSSGAGAVGSHVLSGPANESIDVLQGCQADLDDMVRDAEAGGSKYALRHWKVSPKEGMGTEDARQVAQDLAREFGADSARMLIVEHQKPRAGGAGHDRHWHVIAPEYDPVAGRVLDAHWMRPRHEKLARIAEARLGHDLVPGRWNAAVGRALADEGRPELAARVAAVAEQPRPESGYSATQHQTAARRGHAMPHDRLTVAAAWRQADGAQAFAAALAEQGISIRQGDKAGTFIAERDGQLIGAVHRLVGEKKVAVGERLDGADLHAVPVPGQPVAGLAGPVHHDHEAAAHVPGAAAPAAAGQPPVAPAPEAPNPAAGILAETPAAMPAAGSRDGTQAASGGMAKPAGGGGGNGSAPMAEAGGGGGGASLGDVGDGPGPPPGPGASPDERARWLAKLGAWEDRTASVWAAWVKAQEASGKKAAPAASASGGGQDHAAIQRQAEAVARAVEALFDRLREDWQRARSAEAIRHAIATVEGEADRIRAAAGIAPAPAGRDDRAAGPGGTAGPGNLAGDARAGRPSGGDAGGPDRAKGEGRPEPDRRAAAGPYGDDGEPAQDRGEGRQAVRRVAAQVRLAHGLAAAPEAMERLRAATTALRPDPLDGLTGRARFERLAAVVRRSR